MDIVLTGNPEKDIQTLLEEQATAMCNLRTFQKNHAAIMQAETTAMQEIELINTLILQTTGVNASGPTFKS
jgi:hypothetical protein